MIRMRDPRYVIRYSLSPGEMVAFDNRRVLHGRTAFDATSGDRHLRGYYIEQNEIDSRIRVLSRSNTRRETHQCP
jgi:gamma-butyrobetaine dioxygenase